MNKEEVEQQKIEPKTCKRCGQTQTITQTRSGPQISGIKILSNGLCVRCDHVLFDERDAHNATKYIPPFSPGKIGTLIPLLSIRKTKYG